MPQAHSYALNVETIAHMTTLKPPPYPTRCNGKETISHLVVPEIRIEPPKPLHPNEVLGGSSTTLLAKPDSQKQEEKEEKPKNLSFLLELEFDAFVLVCFIIAIVVPLSMVVMGGVYILSCPAEMMIPIFLIVSGSALLVSGFGLRKLAEKQNQPLNRNASCYQTLLRTAVFIQFAWFISGCVWVYRVYEPDYITSTSPNYCNQTLYQYSFWLLNSFFITLAVTILGCFVYVCFGHHKTTDLEPAMPTKV